MYEVKKIDLSNINSPEDYQKAMYGAVPHHFKKLSEVWNVCGAILPRQRCGYAGTIRNIEYVVTRV